MKDMKDTERRRPLPDAEACLLYTSSPQWSNNTYTRFTTETIRKLFPQHTKPISGWKTTDMAFYEIIKRENYFKITLSLCSDNLTDEQRAACDRVSQALNRPDRKEDWRWKRIRNWPRHTIESEPNSENYKEEIYRYLNTNWREIQKFENDLLNKTAVSYTHLVSKIKCSLKNTIISFAVIGTCY